MSDLLINIRIGLYHFQLTNQYKMTIKRNDAHKDNHDGYFSIYEFFGLV